MFSLAQAQVCARDLAMEIVAEQLARQALSQSTSNQGRMSIDEFHRMLHARYLNGKILEALPGFWVESPRGLSLEKAFLAGDQTSVARSVSTSACHPAARCAVARRMPR